MTTPEDRELWERDEEALRNEVRQLNATLDRASRDAITEARAYVALHEKARADAAKAARVEALADEWEGERDTCLAWIADPTMHVDPEHPKRLSKLADLLNRHAEKVRAALADAPAEQRAEGGA